MSLEKIDQYLSELEAVKSYRQVKEETQKLKSRNIELEGRIDELERMKVTSEGKTIKEAEEAFLKAKKEEISKEAKEESNETHAKWQRDEKPKEVFDVSVRELKMILHGLSEAPHEVAPYDLAQAGLVVEVKKILNEEVQKRLDVEFNKRVEARSNKIALEKLEDWKKFELKRWYDEKVIPEIARLGDLFNRNIIAFLRNTDWIIPCDKCGSQQFQKFTGKMVSDLITRGRSALPCINASCKDPVNVKHQIPITLEGILDFMIRPKIGYP